MQSTPEHTHRRFRIPPPPESDLIGIPLVVGMAVAALVVVAGFVIAGWLGMVLLVAALVVALAISYRLVTDS